MSNFNEPTPGIWFYREPEPGFMGDLEEPPQEPYPPTVVAQTARGEIELAQLNWPVPEDATTDTESGETEVLGDYEANGKLMAAAPQLHIKLAKLVVAVEFESYERGGAIEPETYKALREASELLSEVEPPKPPPPRRLRRNH